MIRPYRIDVRLSPAKLTNVEANIDLSGVKMTRGDFNLSELSDKMDQPETNQLIVRTYIHMARHRRSTLVFCVDLSHVESLTAAFRKAGIDARFVTSLSKNTERRETLAAFLNGEFPVLINCEVLTEGADIPTVSFSLVASVDGQIDCIILARPCRSRNLLAQMVRPWSLIFSRLGRQRTEIVADYGQGRLSHYRHCRQHIKRFDCVTHLTRPII